MNWPRTIMDGIVMALLFNAVVGVGFLLYPQAYSTMFPKEIKEAAAPFVDPRQVKKDEADYLSAVSFNACILGNKRTYGWSDGLLDFLLDRICGDDTCESRRFPDS